MPLILLRHTRPLDAEGLCYGRSDIDLAEDFETAADAVLAGLPPVSHVISSPRLRCLRLATRIAAERNLAHDVDARIAEMDFGYWERRLWADIPRNEIALWAADFHGAHPHGGESVTALSARVTMALAEAPRLEPPVLWVTHSGVVRAVCAHLGIGDGWQTDLGFGAWLDLTGDPPSSSPSRDR